MNNASILGVKGPVLTEQERQFLPIAQPFGFILFARNVQTPDQLRALTSSLRDAVGWNAPILIDQEGGRVQRMRSPHWRDYLPALDQNAQASDPVRAMWVRNRLIAAELWDVGIDVNCAPLVDLVEPQTHPVLRNRLYGDDVNKVVQSASACIDAFLAGGVLPVLKHIPGYGRASVDSHSDLPRVGVQSADLNARDFAPFRALSDVKMGMTAHIVFDDIDPNAPATTSSVMMDVIRNDIGFGGLIMTDDISMGALSGSVGARSAAAIAAGCDVVLHCNGDLDEMKAVVDAAGPLSKASNLRATSALAQRQPPTEIDISALSKEFDSLLS